MANSAPYHVDIVGTDDETFAFSLPWQLADGTAFPFASYAIEYVVRDEGGGPVFTLAEVTTGSGIYVDTASGTVTFKKDQGALSPGVYEHGCRIRSLETGDVVQVFDGTVSITEGSF